MGFYLSMGKYPLGHLSKLYVVLEVIKFEEIFCVHFLYGVHQIILLLDKKKSVSKLFFIKASIELL